jgi:hypothetical protein
MYLPIDVGVFNVFRMNIDKLWSYEGFMQIQNYYNWETAGLTRPKCEINIRDYRIGPNLFTGLGPASTDGWSNFIICGMNGLDCVMNIDTAYINKRLAGNISLFYGLGYKIDHPVEWKNQNFVVNVRVLKQTYFGGNAVSGNGLVGMLFPPAYTLGQTAPHVNNHLTINIDQAEISGNFFSTYTLIGLNNSSITVNVRDYMLSTSTVNSMFTVFMTGNIGGTFINSTDNINNQITVRGRFSTSSPAGIFGNGSLSNSARFSSNYLGFRFEDSVLIQKAAAPNGAITLVSPSATWGNLLNMSIVNTDILTAGGNSLNGASTVTVLVKSVLSNQAPGMGIAYAAGGGSVTVVGTLGNYLKS